MKFCYFLLALSLSSLADFKPMPEQFKVEKDGNLPSINVSFNVGNTQEAPAANTAAATATAATQKIQIEHIHKSEPAQQDSFFGKIRNGVAAAIGTVAVVKVVEHSDDIIVFFKKIILRG